MELILIWILFGILSAVAANSKGRSGFGWFFVGLLIGPFGLILVLLLPKMHETVERTAIKQGESKKCPYCAELIKPEAIICRFCGSEVTFDFETDSSKKGNNFFKKWGVPLDWCFTILFAAVLMIILGLLL